MTNRYPGAAGVTLATMAESGPPELRASDAERERTAELLRRAAGEGRLTIDEFDERLDAAYAARTRSELERLVADVDVPHASTPSSGLTVRPGEDEGNRWLVSVMGGLERKGRWRVGRRCVSVNVMGGADLDLNDAELAAPTVELSVFSLMGGGDVYVPAGLNVDVSDFAFMGANEVRLGDATPTPGGPTVRLKLISIMGGSSVRRGRKLTRSERKRQRQERHRLHP
jgi:hypothetical protein